VLYRDIGNKIESIVKPKGYGIVRQYTAHGINQLVSPEDELERGM
jgi:methionyl aminopeptidase